MFYLCYLFLCFLLALQVQVLFKMVTSVTGFIIICQVSLPVGSSILSRLTLLQSPTQ